jgi:chromosome segregation protein
LPHISKIELRGFKSFGNTKVSIPLSRGLTAIVGPNGMGKSNIVDALCFVLGWMSAKIMRAERFSDLLFKGGNGHRPAPFAEVSLYFNNEDGRLPINSETVVISRWVNRDGKCVYRINKKRVNRQEIVDLLAASMTSPGGHNFVMQGDVDHFIKMDPIDRRMIIDEIAGVAEYDEKKQKSMAELQKVETNLNTAGTVLNEISGQMESLKTQMETAVRYKQLKRELEQIRVTLLLMKKETHAKKLSQLKSRIEKLNEEIQRLKGRHQTIIGEISGQEEKIRKLDDLIDERHGADVLEEVRGARAQVSAMSGLLESTARKQSEIDQEIAGLTDRIKKMGGLDGETASNRVASLTTKFNDLREKFNVLSRSLDESKSLADARDILHGLKVVLDELAPVVDKLSKQVFSPSRPHSESQHGPTAVELHNELIGLKRTRTELEKQFSELQEKIRETQSKLESASASEKEIRSSIEDLRAERGKLRTKVHVLEEKARDLDGKIKESEANLQGWLIQKASLETDMRSVREEMKKVKVEINLPTTSDPKTLENRAITVEGEMNSLGEVNFRAIQDFRVAERRHNSEKQRYDKLTAEKQSLLDFMRNIDEKKKEVFMKTFSEISRHFGEIFGQLSPEGTAELILENEQLPFDGGLEIRARPQGKDVSYVNAMSGGERALTALAFIFALQKYRPSTFYVLDEIDAHLDPQNRKRVAEMLRQFSHESQIVVITLHDAMMSAADRLFGVTMEDKISHLLSVELSGLGG